MSHIGLHNYEVHYEYVLVCLQADEYLEREKRRVRALERRSREDDYRRRNVLMKEKRDLAEQQRRVRMEEERLNREREKMR